MTHHVTIPPMDFCSIVWEERLSGKSPTPYSRRWRCLSVFACSVSMIPSRLITEITFVSSSATWVYTDNFHLCTLLVLKIWTYECYIMLYMQFVILLKQYENQGGNAVCRSQSSLREPATLALPPRYPAFLQGKMYSAPVRGVLYDCVT